MKRFPYLFLLLYLVSCTPGDPVKDQRYRQWHPVRLDFEGPGLAENRDENPFTDFRLEVLFSHDSGTYRVPGFFAADGNAAETGAAEGNLWRVLFNPPFTGQWEYAVSFRKGQNIAVNPDPEAGQRLEFDGASGSFRVEGIDSINRDFKTRGLLVTEGHYYRESGSGAYFLKMGANSPENFLAYREFDGTYYAGDNEQRSGESAPNQGLHAYDPHLRDWQEGDPVWQENKGKGIIGALNYLASKGMNSVYFLTMNIGGDGQDVFPYRSHEDFTRFDCSKLDQWDIVFSHAEKLGIVLHMVTQETENETLLDNGDTGFQRQLYYRELVARFGYHNNIIWNMGEENGPANFSPDGQSPQQRLAMADWFARNDPYEHPVVVHSHAWAGAKDETLTPLLGVFGYDGISMQVDRKEMVHDEFLKWREYSALSGNPWALSMDEIGMYHTGAKPDADDPERDSLRTEVLWGSLMAGGTGVEWYFGYRYPGNDLNSEDWRMRDKLWDQTRIAKEFFERNLPWWEMEPADELILEGEGYCLAKPGEIYAVYLKPKQEISLDLQNTESIFNFRYFNPKEGLWDDFYGEMGGGTVATFPFEKDNDYLLLILKTR